MKAYGLIRLFIHEENLYNKFKFAFNLLTIKVFLVMFFINIFLISEYKNLKITLRNFKTCHKFISNANSSKFNYSEEELFKLNVLQPID